MKIVRIVAYGAAICAVVFLAFCAWRWTGPLRINIDTDLYTVRPYLLSTKEHLLYDVRSGAQGGRDRIDAYVKAHPRDSRFQGRANDALCESTWRDETAALHCNEHSHVVGEAVEDTVPAEPGRFDGGSGSVAVLPDGQITVAMGNRSTHAVWEVTMLPDTGTYKTTLAASIAEKLGVRFDGSKYMVYGATGTPVEGRGGILDGLAIGHALLEDVPVTVIPDQAEADRDPSGKWVQREYGLLGLAALRAFGTVAWKDHGRTLVVGQGAWPCSTHQVPFQVRLGTRIVFPIDGDRSLPLWVFRHQDYFLPLKLTSGQHQAFLDTGADWVLLSGWVSYLVDNPSGKTLTAKGRRVFISSLGDDEGKDANVLTIDEGGYLSIAGVKMGIDNLRALTPSYSAERDWEWVGFPLLRSLDTFGIDFGQRQLCLAE